MEIQPHRLDHIIPLTRNTISASLTPAVPLHRAHGFQSGDNLAHRVGVRAVVKPYVFGFLEKS